MTIFTRDDLVTLKADRLMSVAANYFPGGDLPSDDELWFKLLAEETSLETRFRTLFSVREIYSTGTPQADLDALAASGATLLEEPGYDYTPKLFQGEAWGLLELRHKPIVAVHSISFAYPGPGSSLFTVPADWIRPEKKYGRLNIVPSTSAAINFPANAYIMSALGGGRTIPFMVQVRYSAGMPNIRTERPDIVDAIRRMTVLSILDDQFFPTSGSDSIDGLSQSTGFDTQKYRDLTDKRLEQIGQSLSGIRMMVL